MFQQILLRRIKKPQENVNMELQWLSSCLGMFSSRDKSGSCFRIFIELLKATKMQKPLSSDELAYKLNLSRGAVVHHLNRLIESGIVVSYKNKYALRSGSLEILIREIKKDVDAFLDDVIPVAEDIDRALA